MNMICLISHEYDMSHMSKYHMSKWMGMRV